MKKACLLAGGAFAVYAILVWLGAGWLRLQAGEAWLFRFLMWLIGAMAAALVLYMVWVRRPSGQAPAAGQDGSLSAEVRFLVREANARLGSFKAVRGGGASIAGLPLVLVLGDSGSGKTTMIVHSGQEPELLAGQARQDDAITPTRCANLWIGGGVVFVESAGALTSDAPAFSSLAGALRARGLASLLGRAGQAPRAVVLCCDCGQFGGPDARNSMAEAARRYQAALGEIAHRWGRRLPVYVLFTKLDRLPYFADYFRGLSKEEAAQFFGVTLPVSLDAGTGAYTDQQDRRLAQAFDSLFLTLDDHRIEHLRRENDPSRLPNIYEFPREFRRMRNNAIRFLLDAGRPSQLRTSPFLRGFYFTGVRTIVAEDGSPMAALPASPGFEGDIGATRILNGLLESRAASTGRQVSGQRMPQWVFLSGFVRHVLLGDRVARATSGRDVRAGLVRRVLLAGASALLCLWMIGATVSFFNNRGLADAAANSSRALASARSVVGQAPPAALLAELNRLREVAATASANQRYGAPMSFRWGLYPGSQLYDNSRALYCGAFGRLMLADARASFERTLRSLPGAPRPEDDYGKPFGTLKAYLMTTSDPSRTQPGFLAAALWEAWSGNRALTDEQRSLARRQFEFYASERASGLCPARADAGLVDNARIYLRQFQPLQRIYANMLAEVSARGKPHAFSDPARAVIDDAQVPFQYTKAGWPQMRDAIRNRARYYNPEPWVLGGETASVAAGPEFEQSLRQLYTRDYVVRWQQYLARAAIAPYASFADASPKLDGITASQSSLLRLFCGVSVNTAVEDPEVRKEFQPIQALVSPATCETQLNGPPTQLYMGEMARLKFQVDEIAKRPEGADPALDSIAAKTAARTTAQNLNLPKKAENLLLDPILYAEKLIERKAPDAVNARGADFCRAVAALYRKYPFNSGASEEVNLADFAAVFQPGSGLLWKFYQETLQELLAQQGAGYIRKPGAKLTAYPAFLRFFNQAAGVSRAFFPANAARPALSIQVQAAPSTDVDSFVLQVGGKQLRGSGNGGERQEFAWTGEDVSVSLTAQAKVSAAPLMEKGPWALFRVLDRSNRVSGGGAVYEYDLATTLGRQPSSAGSKPILRLRVDVAGSPGLLGELRSGCVARVAQ